MERTLILLETTARGEGSTTILRRLTDWMESVRGLRVGGFSLARVYRRDPGAGHRHVGYEAMFLDTGNRYEVARTDYPGWLPCDLGATRLHGEEHGGTFHVNPAALPAICDQLERDARENGVDAIVVDSLSPILNVAKGRGEAQRRRLLDILRSITFSDTPIIIISMYDFNSRLNMAGELREWVRANSKLFGRAVHSRHLDAHTMRIETTMLSRLVLGTTPARNERIDPAPAI